MICGQGGPGPGPRRAGRAAARSVHRTVIYHADPMNVEYSGTGDPGKSMALLWRKSMPPVRTRGPKPALSVDRIVAVAIEIADVDGLAALSMRRVAERLGVGAMSLYTYVPGKAELIDVMLDTVYGETARPEPAPVGWRPALEAIARENLALYLRHPWMVQIATSRPPLGPNVIAKYDHELRALDGVGLTDVEMDSALTLVLSFVHGAAREVVQAGALERRTGITDAQWWNAYAPLLQQVVPSDEYPVAVRVGSAAGQTYGGASAPAHAFEFGLQRVLDGIAVLID